MTHESAQDSLSQDGGSSIAAHPDEIEDEQAQAACNAFYAALDQAAYSLLAQLTAAGTVRASFYPELLTHQPIMWAVTPSVGTTQRYTPREWELLVHAAFATDTYPLETAEQWHRLARWGRYGH